MLHSKLRVWAAVTLGACGALALIAPDESPAKAPSCTEAKSLPADIGTATATTATLCLINRERTTRGMGRLRANGTLAKVARGHAADMVAKRYFSHDTPSGVDFFTRVKAAGYRGRSAGLLVGENLAWGSGVLASPDQIVRAWMRSPGHRANILRPGFREIGLGVVSGTPRPDAPIGATYASAFGRRTS
jgi:uncharacterized protein YkwD